MRSLFCGLAACLFMLPAHAGTLEPHVVRAAGLDRHYLLYVPDQVKEPAALVLYHHGGGMSAQKAATGSTNTGRAWQDLADQEGFLVAYPNGTSSNGATGGDIAMFNDCGRQSGVGIVTSDDVAAARAVVLDVGSRLPVDGNRIYATGVSNGGLMAMRLGREAGDLFAAVGSIAAVNPRPADDQCLNGSRVAPILLAHGTADLFMPFRGGCGAGGACRLGFEDTVAAWRDWLGLGYEPMAKSRISILDRNRLDFSTISCTDYASSELVSCVVTGGGHNEPSISIRLGLLGLLFGNQNGDAEAAALQWEFFRAKRLDGTPFAN